MDFILRFIGVLLFHDCFFGNYGIGLAVVFITLYLFKEDSRYIIKILHVCRTISFPSSVFVQLGCSIYNSMIFLACLAVSFILTNGICWDRIKETRSITTKKTLDLRLFLEWFVLSKFHEQQSKRQL